MIRHIKIYILLFLSGTFFFACNGGKAEKEAVNSTEAAEGHHEEEPTIVELTEKQYKIAGIELGKIQQKNLSNTIAVNGVLDVPPQNLVSISAPLGGFIKNTELLQGMQVKKGQVIAIIENPEFITLQQDYIDSKSRLEYIELEYSRQKELAAENVSSAKTFQQTTAEYKSVRNRVNALEEKLALIGIPAKRLESGKITRSVAMHAPINGYVTEVNVNIGKFVNPTDVLFEIVDTEHLHVELTIYERDVTKLKKGQKIRFTLPNESGRERMATLYLIGREISAERTVRVHAHLDQEDEQLLPGMYVKAYIETDNATTPALPQEALVQSESKDYIYVFKGKRKEGEEVLRDFQMVEVQKGVSESGYTQIILSEETDSATSQIVVKGAFALLSKMKNSEEEGHGH